MLQLFWIQLLLPKLPECLFLTGYDFHRSKPVFFFADYVRIVLTEVTYMHNIFLDDNEPETLDTFLGNSEDGRVNLGDAVPVTVYRLLEYSLKLELRNRYDKETQISIFRSAGKTAGEYFTRTYLDTSLSFDSFISQLQKKMEEFKIGVLRIENIDEKTGKIILTVSEDADCSGLPVIGETVCNYDEGFISGILSTYTGKEYNAVEVDCWATGDRVCRFHVNRRGDEEHG